MRTFRGAGWFVNVSRLGETAGVAEGLVAEVGAFVVVLEAVDVSTVGTATDTCDLV